MPKKLKISLIIPAFNEEKRLATCLDAVLAQKLPFDEVIVVNNSSTDQTATIAERYPVVKLVDEPQKGRVFAREAGFRATSGDILARIDADAILPVDWSQKVADYYARDGALSTAWTGGAFFYNVRFPSIVSSIYNTLVFGFNRLLIGHPTLWGSNMALPKQLWQEVAGEICLRNDIHEDLDLAIHLHRQKRRIFYDKAVRVRVELRRVRSNRHELWDYLQMWPRTLRIHGIRTWPVCWLFGDVLLYIFTPLFGLAESIARLFGRQPIDE
ncbi:MAG: glycosyltransferase family 2 protein [Candidatus Saccharimonadales bacterium]